MIVEQLRVRNWRHLRDEHAFEFGEEMNLLIGPNEAGKSTLFEVLQRVLLDRHTGRAQEIRELRPIGSSLAPEAEVTLRSGDDRYRVRKRFLDSPISVLSVERDGNWEREHEGTRADEEARSLVEGDVPGKGATAREHRGLGEALWYLQREAPLPDDEWNEAIQEGLGGLIDVAASSSAERRILDRIADEYSETWTKSEGNLSKRSDLYDLKEEVEDLEEALEDVEAALKKADELRADLKSLLAEQERLAQELSDAQGRRESLREKLDEAEEVRERKEKLESECEDARRERGETQADLEELEELADRIGELNEEIEEAEEEQEQLERLAEQARSRRDEARQRRTEELEPERTEVSDRLEGLRALERLWALEDEEARLEDRAKEVREKRKRRDALQEELSKLEAPSEEDLEEYRSAREELVRVEAKAEASAILVEFDLNNDVSVIPEPDPEAVEDGKYRVIRPTEFKIDGVGSVSVRGGGQSLQELREQADDLRKRITEIEDRYDAEGQEGLNELHQRRADLEESRAEARGQIEELTEKREPEERLAEVRREIQEQRENTGEVSDDLRELRGAALTAKQEKLVERRDELREEIDDLQEQEDQAQEEYEERKAEAQEQASQVSGLRATRKARRQDREKIIERYGTVDRLETEHEERVERVDALEKELEEVQEEYEKRVVEPEEELERTEEEISRLDDAVQEAEGNAREMKGRIQEIADQDVYAEAGDLEAKLEAKQRRYEVRRQRAEGTKLLKELTDTLKEERTGKIAEPVTERVNRWVEVLTDGRYDGLEVDENLQPSGVWYPRYEASLPLRQLSYGTREQVVVLFRLAIAQLLAEGERQLVVLDDRLVNADPARTRQLCDILDEAADSCQILLATCDPSRYQRVAGHQIRIPNDGKESQ